MESVQSITVEQFISDHQLKLTSHEVTTRPDGFMGDSAYHFRCRISKGKQGFGFYWSQGSGCGSTTSGFPDVLDTLASDAASYENANGFEEWAEEMGSDADSRQAEKTYRAVKRGAEQLKRLLGQDAYEQLIWNVNR
jgi:hypothetical protein